jgi:hypothetical protein
MGEGAVHLCMGCSVDISDYLHRRRIGLFFQEQLSYTALFLCFCSEMYIHQLYHYFFVFFIGINFLFYFSFARNTAQVTVCLRLQLQVGGCSSLLSRICRS